MSTSAGDGGVASAFSRLCTVRRFTWLMALLPALMAALWLGPTSAQAGTITIVNGPNIPPTPGGVYTDGYINAQLAASSLVITTTGVITGPNEIRVLQGVTIAWTTGNQLTLDAGSSIVISGTIQHDGPTNGAGGVRLLTSGSPTGTVTIGTGTQSAGVAAGSRFGLTRMQAGNLVLRGGNSGTTPYALLGFRAVDQGAAYTVTGPISVTVSQDVSATGSATVYGFVQIGHGGADTSFDFTPSGAFSGGIAVTAGRDVIFQGGSVNFAYAQLGNGGAEATGNHSGDIRLGAGRDVAFWAGGLRAYAHVGHGGYGTNGNHSGNHTVVAGGEVSFLGGNGVFAYAQMGNGGLSALGNHSGNQSLDAGGDVTFQGDRDATYVQLGNGGFQATGSNSGDQRLKAGGDVTFQGGISQVAYAQLGNGGQQAPGNQSGDLSLEAEGDVSFQGGSGSATSAQLGNGGVFAGGNDSGNLALTATGSLTLTPGSGQDAYVMAGHGSDARLFPFSQSSGSRAGDIALRVGASAFFNGSQVGHLTASGVLSVTQSNTLIGVSQNKPSAAGSGQLRVSSVTTSSFSSAPTANGGELRIYLPRADSQQIPLNATFNGASFTVANTIPPAQLAGVALFGEGPYLPDYSFYLGKQPNAGITKRVTPGGPLAPGQALTYTLSFSNTGSVTATGVVVQDPLPVVLSFSSATLQPEAGVSITQTGSAPNLAWAVSDLGIGQGGQIVVAAAVQNSSAVLATTFTNTATISATGDITLTNNSAPITTSVIPGATLIVTKTVVGGAPATAWQFVGSGGIGGFNLPTGGGSQSFTPLIPGAFTITETVKSGYTAAVSCTTGQSGTNSVSISLASGQSAGCTFTNTFVPTPVITQTLTVDKVVVGGPLSADDFDLFVDGAPVNRGVATSLSAGQHTVSETGVSTYTASFGGACNANGVVNLASGVHRTCTITNTYTPEPPQDGAVEGLVYVDENGNSQPDTGEGLQGVTVTLQSETGVAAGLLTDVTDSTDANGEYAFANVPAGEYTLSFEPPGGYAAMEDVAVTVVAEQTTTVPDQGTTRAFPFTVYVPIISQLAPELPPTQ